MRSIRSILCRLGNSGSAAVQFALVAPIYLLLTFATFEIGMAFYADLVLQNAVQTSGRLIRTGQAQNQNMSQAAFRSDICNRISFIMSCNAGKLFVDVRSFANFGGANFPAPLDAQGNLNPNLNSYQPGASSQVAGSSIVLVRVFYEWPLNAPIFSNIFSNVGHGSNIRLLSSSVAFRNEPF